MHNLSQLLFVQRISTFVCQTIDLTTTTAQKIVPAYHKQRCEQFSSQTQYGVSLKMVMQIVLDLVSPQLTTLLA